MSEGERPLDLVAVGRAAVDLYGDQLGSPLEDVASFNKSLGGCAANIAVGAARLGLRVAMLTRVGDEHMGRFVQETLREEGVDVAHVKTDPDRLTALVLLSVRGADTFPLIFYRERCADMNLGPEDVDPALISSAQAVLLTGTHLSQPRVRAASLAVLAAAKAAGTKVVLDVDYRPVLWGLTGHDRGEDRYVASARVSEVLQEVLPECDLVVGTEEELRIAGGQDDLHAALVAVRAKTDATLVVKRGPQGAVVLPGPVPVRLEDGLVAPGRPVEVLNVLGAGDAFMAGFLSGWLRDQPLAEAARRANGAGALVVSRHMCAPAMPTAAELDAYLDDAPPERVARLHRLAGRPPPPEELCVLAFDHRTQLEGLAHRVGADLARVEDLKRLIARGAARAAVECNLACPGVIVDGVYGRPVLEALSGPEHSWWVARPVELPGDPGLGFEGDPNVELALYRWPKRHVVKCLVSPVLSDHALTHWQNARLVRLFRACVALERELLLEVLPRRRPDESVDPELLPEVLERLYDLGIQPEWWKLPPPAHDDVWFELDRVVARRDPECNGVLVLGLDAPSYHLAGSLQRAGAHPLCRGFAVGRTIFFEPAERWLVGAASDEDLVSAVADGFAAMVTAFRAGKEGR
ncbi:MAG: 5-dehydro-2-deoxygluconokinase [Deltaproteobacteria bacterium]|nr:5-dehydro-2-deoxygluconokinase [Deltaproteobacteria bacterium]